MNITIYGVGYVGLVQGAVMADSGHDVICIDNNLEKIDGLNNGIIPIYEPELSLLVQNNQKNERLRFSTDPKLGVDHGELQFIAVGTPPDEDGSADLKYVLEVAETIATHMNSPKILINKSTVPVGTADLVNERVSRVLKDRGVSLEFHTVSNPEFLKEGSAVQDCKKPDRIIIGTDNLEVSEKMREAYAPFNRNHDRVMIMDVRSAELTKYAANCMLATKISFINEMANLAEAFGADIEAVREGIGADNRIGYSFIYPGCGYGGSCFPKDVKALIQKAENHKVDAQLLKSVEAVNWSQKRVLFDKINKYFNGDLKSRVIALWGLSFKPNTDDMREAPSRVLMEALWEAGAIVQAFDPVAMDECRRIYGERPELILVDRAEEALVKADALVIVTEWQQFRSPDYKYIVENLKQPLIFDGRNIYDPKRLKSLGITYYSIGR